MEIEYSPLRHSSSKPKGKEIAILSVAYMLTVYFYWLSLEGGDIEFIKDNLGRIGRYVMISIASFFAFNVIMYHKYSATDRKCLMLQIAIFITTFVGFYFMDHGDTLDNHGSYNLLIFIILFMPGTISLFVVVNVYSCLSTSGKKKCRMGSVLFGTFAFIAMAFSLSINREKFSLGLSGTRMLESPQVCQPTGWNLPWFDLFPQGAQNFWTGSQICVPKPKHYTASISETGYVRVANCSTTPKVTFFPNTKDFAPKNKTYKTMHIHIKDLWIEKEITDMKKGIKIPDGVEAMYVECGEDQERQMLYHIQVQKPKSQQKKGSSKDKPNILMLFIDATGRRQFFRRLPKTVKWLEKMQEGSSSNTQMDVLQFLRYHVMGFNTGPTSIAMYCGQNESAPGFYDHAMDDPMCPMWKPFQKQGYSTLVVNDYCEDWSGIYLRNSSSKHFNHEMIAPFCHPDYFPYEGNPFGNFKGPYSILRRCLFGDYVHKHSLNYLDQAIRTYSKAEQPYFMLGSFIEAHEGTGEVLATMDNDLTGFLSKLDEENLLENTVVIIAADHGLHMGINFAFLENGKLEHRFPFLSMLIPSKYNRNAIDKLKENEQKLVTAFDLHHTLLKLPGFRSDGSFDSDVVETSIEARRRQLQENTPAGSLFDSIPWNRTCEEASIPEELCECRFAATAKPSNSGNFLPGVDDEE